MSGYTGGHFYESMGFESPLERDFAWLLSKYLLNTAKLHANYRCPTRQAEYRLDLRVQQGEHAFGIEIDGQDYHSSFSDRWRDRFIIASKHVHAIYRIPGWVAHHVPNAALEAISALEPEAFKPHARRHFQRLAATEHSEAEPPIGSSRQIRHVLIELHSYAKRATLQFIPGEFTTKDTHTEEGREWWLVPYHLSFNYHGQPLDTVDLAYLIISKLVKGSRRDILAAIDAGILNDLPSVEEVEQLMRDWSVRVFGRFGEDLLDEPGK